MSKWLLSFSQDILNLHQSENGPVSLLLTAKLSAANTSINLPQDNSFSKSSSPSKAVKALACLQVGQMTLTWPPTFTLVSYCLWQSKHPKQTIRSRRSEQSKGSLKTTGDTFPLLNMNWSGKEKLAALLLFLIDSLLIKTKKKIHGLGL